MCIREKQHRLQESNYRGEISVSFTLCIKDRFPLFKNASIVNIFENILRSEAARFLCIIPVYCYMPDHQHLIVSGINSKADTLNLIRRYQQGTGYWLARQDVDTGWQKDFFDHIIRKEESLVDIAKYILNNPVRKGLVSDWQDYPFKGSIGCELDYILQAMA